MHSHSPNASYLQLVAHIHGTLRKMMLSPSKSLAQSQLIKKSAFFSTRY
ncbi:hypothetical protein [Rubritalea tangerina]